MDKSYFQSSLVRCWNIQWGWQISARKNEFNGGAYLQYAQIQGYFNGLLIEEKNAFDVKLKNNLTTPKYFQTSIFPLGSKYVYEKFHQCDHGDLVRPVGSPDYLQTGVKSHLKAMRRLYDILNAGKRQEAVMKVSFQCSM